VPCSDSRLSVAPERRRHRRTRVFPTRFPPTNAKIFCLAINPMGVWRYINYSSLRLGPDPQKVISRLHQRSVVSSTNIGRTPSLPQGHGPCHAKTEAEVVRYVRKIPGPSAMCPRKLGDKVQVLPGSNRLQSVPRFRRHKSSHVLFPQHQKRKFSSLVSILITGSSHRLGLCFLVMALARKSASARIVVRQFPLAMDSKAAIFAFE